MVETEHVVIKLKFTLCFIKYNIMASMYCTTHQNREQNKARCQKCNDTYILHYGGKSQRTRCRNHHYIVNQLGQMQCLDCNLIKNEYSVNCYHTSKPTTLCAIL
jgi:hypothetical protein